MATKRMLSSKIVDSDAFLDMPHASQLLYFHLAMGVDDDGFVGNPKKIMRMVDVTDSDLKILFSKRFIIGFDSGIIVIKHHRMNNNWDKHNCKRTQYLEEFEQLNIKENGTYTLNKKEGLSVQSEFRLKTVGKKSLDEKRIEENRIDKNRIDNIYVQKNGEFPYQSFLVFWETYPLKQGKKVARDSWDKINPSKELFDEIIKHVNLAKEKDDRWLKGYTPLASTYLNQERWNDEITKKPTGSKLEKDTPHIKNKYSKMGGETVKN